MLYAFLFFSELLLLKLTEAISQLTSQTIVKINRSVFMININRFC